MNSAKRRRLNEPPSALTKPFRSPLKSSRAGQNSNDSQSEKDNNVQDTPDGYSKHKDDVEPQVSSSLPPPTIVEPVLNMKDPSQMTSTCHNSSIDLTETVKALKKEHAILAQRLQQQRQDLTVLQQTLTIRSTNQEEKLNILIAKWRNVARDAADDLFESASARVKEMGGLESWHNNTSRAYLKDWTDPNENNRSSSERHTDDENDREYLQEVADVEAQSAKLNHQVVSINQEHQLTMEMMLRQLNIDPELLGFDTENEQWCD